MRRYVAFLRGINVSGKHKLPMKSLVALLEQVGCADVETYIQSGNVVFSATASLARKVSTSLANAIEHEFGFEVPVVTRTAAEMKAIVSRNPFLRRGKEPGRLHVAFLAGEPKPATIANLDPERSPPDVFHVDGQQIYLHTPNGMARTKLTNAYFDSKLGMVSTIRNWNTVLKMAAMVGD